MTDCAGTERVRVRCSVETTCYVIEHRDRRATEASDTLYGDPVIATHTPGPDSVQHPVPYAVRVRTAARTPSPTRAPSLSARRLRARDPLS